MTDDVQQTKIKLIRSPKWLMWPKKPDMLIDFLNPFGLTAYQVLTALFTLLLSTLGWFATLLSCSTVKKVEMGYTIVLLSKFFFYQKSTFLQLDNMCIVKGKLTKYEEGLFYFLIQYPIKRIRYPIKRCITLVFKSFFSL